MKPFNKREVPIILTGEQWTALLAQLLRVELSDKGKLVADKALFQLERQLLANQKARANDA